MCDAGTGFIIAASAAVESRIESHIGEEIEGDASKLSKRVPQVRDVIGGL